MRTRCMQRTRVRVSAFVGLLCACVVPRIDLSGRPCPCLDDWVCDPQTQTCVPMLDGATETTGAAQSTTSTETGTPTQAGFEVLAFAADWSTPGSIHWTWDVAGDAADFHAYELWVARSPEALSQGSDVQVFDSAANPELSRWALNNTMGTDFVRATITDGLEPGVEYFAQLFVLDTAGGRTSSPNVAVRSTTASPVSEHVIFSDEPPGGGHLPACMLRTDAAPAVGTTHHYAHVMRCDPELGSQCERTGAPECWENLRLQGFVGAELSIGNGEFADAFVEVYVAIDGPEDVVAHGWWSDIGLRGSDSAWSSYTGLTLRADGSYRRYQIPLTQAGLTPDAFDGLITGFRVGSTFPEGATVRFDEVRILW